MQVLLIVNPAASSVTPRSRVVIQKALAADHTLSVAETDQPGHAERLARGAADDGTEVVVALGGDGTLNEAANGLAGSSTALAILPGGARNVFARTIGISQDPLEATGQLLSSLHRRSYRRIGLGAVNGRRFLFHTGIGFDAAVAARVERRPDLPRFAGQSVAAARALLNWFRHYDHSRPRFSVQAGDELIDGCYLAIVSKTSPYPYLHTRPLVVSPEANLDSPLSVTAFRTLRFAPVLSAVASSPAFGNLRHHPGLVSRSGLASLTVAGPTPFPYQVDGDHLGDVERLEFAFEPDNLTVVMP